MPLHPFLECWTLSYLFWIDCNLGGGSYWRLAVSSPRVDVIDKKEKSTSKDINCIMTTLALSEHQIGKQPVSKLRKANFK